MSRQNLSWGWGLLLAALLVGIFPAATQAQPGVGENFIFVNYIGQELTLDLDDVTYIVPGTNTQPEGGRLALQLAAGMHKYAAHVPGVPLGSAGEFTLEPGGVVAKAAKIEETAPAVDRSGILLAGPKDKVVVFDFDPFAAPATETPVVDSWQPSAAAPGMGSIVWINYSGSDDLTVDLNGQLYKVPPQTNGIPGRLQVDIDPGFYRYTASVPNGSLNGEITIVAGQVTSLAIVPGIREEPEFEVGEKFSPLPPVELKLVQEDITGQVALTQPEAGPAALPATGGEVVVPASLETSPPGLLIKNYAGDALIFTINNQAYTIDKDTEQTLNLPAGRYNFTASLPFVATTGTVELGTGQGVELSIAINVNHDVLSVYQN